MIHMRLRLKNKNKRLNNQKARQESGQTLHELLIASSILSIAITGFSSGIIRSNQITHRSSLRKAAESVIAKDLESNVKRRFYTFRCKQGPCQNSIEENDKNLMYYEQDDSDDKQDFINSCNARDLAKELLDEDIDGITTGEQHIQTNDSLANEEVTITRSISLDDSNSNKAIIKYEAEKESKVIATIKTTLVPNAVNWCS